MAKTSEKKLAYVKAYDKEHSVMVALKLSRKSDADIIEALNKVENRNAFIKQAIRAAIDAV